MSEIPQVEISKIVDRIECKVFDDMGIEDLGEAFLAACRIITRRHYRPPEKRKAIRDELSRRFQKMSWDEHYRQEEQWLRREQQM